MNLSAMEGIVENGQIRLLSNAVLPEKTIVYVVVPQVGIKPAARILSPRLVDPKQAVDFAKQVIEAPLDA